MERFRTTQRPAVWFARELCCWALSPLQHCENTARLAQTSGKAEFKQAILRVSATKGALSLLAFLTTCSKMEAFIIRVKHEL